MILTMVNTTEIAYTQFSQAANYKNCRSICPGITFTYVMPFDPTLTLKLILL